MPILFGITLLTFTLFNVAGGDPAVQFAGKNASAVQIEQIRHELGLDRPLYQQYFFYLKQIVSLDFGRSWSSRQQISTLIVDGVGASLSVSVPPFFISVALCIVLAMFSAFFRGRLFDRSIMVGCLGLMSISYLVYIMVFQYLLGYKMGLFPISGWDASWVDRWPYLILPWICIVVVSLGANVLLYRAVFMEEIFQDYVRTAKAKGLNTRIIYLKHILKNAMIPIITVVVIQMPYLYTGSLLVENFFGIPGIGGLLVQALANADFPVIKAMVFIGSVLYMVFSLLSDLLYALVDPRVQLK